MYAELNMDQGSTFASVFTLSNDDGTAMNLANTGNGAPTFACQIRKSYYSNTSNTITVTILTPNTNGQISLSVDAANTANIKAGRYLYDLKMTRYDAGSNVVIRVLEGIITISPQVTR